MNTKPRMLPRADEVEMSVLGSMLIDKETVPTVVEILPADTFYEPRHERIYGAIRSLFDAGEAIDLITVQNELKKKGELDKAGGALYLTDLMSRVGHSGNVEYHSRIILQAAMARKFIHEFSGLIGQAYEDDIIDVLDRAESMMFTLTASQFKKSAQSISEALPPVLDHLQSIQGATGGITGVSSGFHGLDALTSGFQKSDLIIIAARPSMGKTALAMSIARNAALHPTNPVGVGIFSLEMGTNQLVQRLLTAEGRIDAQKARTGQLSQQEWDMISRAAGRLAASNIFIDDTAQLTPLELRAKARKMAAKHKIGLIIVDYLQLMVSGGRDRTMNREQEVAYVSRSCKALAKELNVPVVALAQLSRAIENRGDKRPMLSDLRESGGIEADADVVAFIHRDEVYGIEVDENGNSTEGLADLIIGKQRNGPLGDVKLAFVKQYSRFENLTTSNVPQGQPQQPAPSQPTRSKAPQPPSLPW